MKFHHFKALAAPLVAATLCVATGGCLSTSGGCPADTSLDSSGNCLSDPTYSIPLGVTSPIGTELPTFYYTNTTGWVVGTGAAFTTPATSGGTTTPIPDNVASFGKGPTLAPGTVTESFTAVAVYNSSNGADVYDPVTGYAADLTGYIVAAGYALSSSGSVVGLIARFTPLGVLDTTFGGGTGYVLGSSSGFTGGNFTMIRSVAIDSQGRIVVGGYGNVQPGSVQNYLTLLDNNFNNDPQAFVSSNSLITASNLFTFATEPSNNTTSVFGNESSNPTVNGTPITVGLAVTTSASVPGSDISNPFPASTYIKSYNTNTGVITLNNPASASSAPGIAYLQLSDYDEILGFVARYLPGGELDSQIGPVYDPSYTDDFSAPVPAIVGQTVTPGSASGGYAVSPSSGFGAYSAVGQRYDVINAVAIDDEDGIYAVGATADNIWSPTKERALVIHYDAYGNLDASEGSQQIDSATEYLTAAAYDPDLDEVVAVGNTLPTSSTSQGITLRYSASDGFDTTFGTTGYLTLAPLGAGTVETFYGVTLDELTNPGVETIVISGQSSTHMMIRTLSHSGSSVSSSLQSSGVNLSVVAASSSTGVALLSGTLNGSAVNRYFTVGKVLDSLLSRCPAIGSIIPSNSALGPDALFSTNPYSTYPITGVTNAPEGFPSPLSFLELVGYQNGVRSTATSTICETLGGSTLAPKSEEFTAIAPSADPSVAIVVGHTTDSSTYPTTGRAFPLLILYGVDGNFPNQADYATDPF